MSRTLRFGLMTVVALVVTGCTIRQDGNRIHDTSLSSPQLPSSGPSYLDIYDAEVCDPPVLDSISPMDVADYQNINYAPITLEECIARALATSEVVRDLGVSIIRTPGSMVTAYDPAEAYTDARVGEEAALSEFDANFYAGAFFQKNDRPFNNLFSGDANGFFQQDLHNYDVEVSKLAATGTQFTIGHSIEYDGNNQAGNRFGSAWQTIVDSEFRHPLLQGSGVLFNRIAGPNQQPGVYNGVLIARTNTEISLTRFEQGVQNLISNVESAYWDLFFAYRELEAQTAARDAALALYQQKRTEQESDRGSSLDTVSAREQYLRFENNIIDSLEGRPVDGTRTDNGIAGGSFRNNVGVRTAERRLRYLLGMPITDGSLLQPADMPFDGAVVFDWNESLQSAMWQRPELRQQKWVIKQKQLELTASRNFLLPRVDLVGNYRFRGLGKNLTGGSNTFADDVANNTEVSNAYGDLLSGDYQEWQVGAEMRMPVGFRRAHNAVRNAEVNLQREKALLREQERSVTLGLSNAVAELRRAYAAMQLAEQRYEAAYQYKQQSAKKVELATANIDVQLEAERRVLDSKLQFLRAEVEYMLAIRNVHYERGSILGYHGVYLTESESDPQAYGDAGMRFSQRQKTMSYVVKNPRITQGLAASTSNGSGWANSMQSHGGFQVPVDMQQQPVSMNGNQPLPLTPDAVAPPIEESNSILDAPSANSPSVVPIIRSAQMPPVLRGEDSIGVPEDQGSLFQKVLPIQTDDPTDGLPAIRTLEPADAPIVEEPGTPPLDPQASTTGTSSIFQNIDQFLVRRPADAVPGSPAGLGELPLIVEQQPPIINDGTDAAVGSFQPAQIVPPVVPTQPIIRPVDNPPAANQPLAASASATNGGPRINRAFMQWARANQEKLLRPAGQNSIRQAEQGSANPGLLPVRR